MTEAELNDAAAALLLREMELRKRQDELAATQKSRWAAFFWTFVGGMALGALLG